MLSILLTGLSAACAAETLVEHHYGKNHNQLDDGFPYTPQQEVDPSDPSFAQGYFLTSDANSTNNARCLDGTPALYYREWPGSACEMPLHHFHHPPPPPA